MLKQNDTNHPYLCLLLNANCVPDAPLERRVSWFVFFNFASLSKLLKSFQMRWVSESDYLRLKLFLNKLGPEGRRAEIKCWGLGTFGIFHNISHCTSGFQVKRDVFQRGPEPPTDLLDVYMILLSCHLISPSRSLRLTGSSEATLATFLKTSLTEPSSFLEEHSK